MIRILLTDDCTIVRKGLRQILAEEYPSAYIEEIGDGETWLEKIKAASWDMVISDLSQPDLQSLEILRQIRRDFPLLGILTMSLEPRETYAAWALQAGASGYLGKGAEPGELIRVVREVLARRMN
jgi:two-component system, NarL family, invasion response regulator UvrY